MRKTKTFKIEGREEITVKELSVKDILSLMQDDVLKDTSVDNLKKIFSERFLPLCTKDVNLNDLLEFAPSELQEIWENFQEVNSAFFDLARASGLLQSVDNIKQALIADFSKLVAT